MTTATGKQLTLEELMQKGEPEPEAKRRAGEMLWQLAEGEAIIIYQDGTRERASMADLIKQALPEPIKGKESYSEGHQVYFLDGYAWGIDAELQPVCLGTEAAVRAAIDNPKLKSGIPEVDAIIEQERQVKTKENEGNAAGHKPERITGLKRKRNNSKRASAIKGAKSGLRTFRRLKAGKKFSAR